MVISLLQKYNDLAAAGKPLGIKSAFCHDHLSVRSSRRPVCHCGWRNQHLTLSLVEADMPLTHAFAGSETADYSITCGSRTYVSISSGETRVACVDFDGLSATALRAQRGAVFVKSVKSARVTQGYICVAS